MKKNVLARKTFFFIVFFLYEECIHSTQTLAENRVLEPKWDAEARFRVAASNKRSLGQLDLFMPVYQNDSSLLFLDFRFWRDTKKNTEGNYGLAYRKLDSSLGWIFGGYGFFDSRQSQFGNSFQQITLGVEALSETWDFRANVYAPFSKAQSIHGEASKSQKFTYRGHKEFTSLNEEVALKGIDVEVGCLIPYTDNVRLYAGEYYFQGHKVPNIKGVRTRLEWRVNDYFYAEADYQYDNVSGGIPSLWLTLRVPFGETSYKKLNPLEKRMSDVIIRDIDIVTQPRKAEVPTHRHYIFAAPGGKGDGTFESPADSNNLQTVQNLLKKHPGYLYYELGSKKIFKPIEILKKPIPVKPVPQKDKNAPVVPFKEPVKSPEVPSQEPIKTPETPPEQAPSEPVPNPIIESVESPVEVVNAPQVPVEVVSSELVPEPVIPIATEAELSKGEGTPSVLPVEEGKESTIVSEPQGQEIKEDPSKKLKQRITMLLSSPKSVQQIQMLPKPQLNQAEEAFKTPMKPGIAITQAQAGIENSNPQDIVVQEIDIPHSVHMTRHETRLPNPQAAELMVLQLLDLFKEEEVISDQFKHEIIEYINSNQEDFISDLVIENTHLKTPKQIKEVPNPQSHYVENIPSQKPGAGILITQAHIEEVKPNDQRVNTAPKPPLRQPQEVETTPIRTEVPVIREKGANSKRIPIIPVEETTGFDSPRLESIEQVLDFDGKEEKEEIPYQLEEVTVENIKPKTPKHIKEVQTHIQPNIEIRDQSGENLVLHSPLNQDEEIVETPIKNQRPITPQEHISQDIQTPESTPMKNSFSPNEKDSVSVLSNPQVERYIGRLLDFVKKEKDIFPQIKQAIFEYINVNQQNIIFREIEEPRLLQVENINSPKPGILTTYARTGIENVYQKETNTAPKPQLHHLQIKETTPFDLRNARQLQKIPLEKLNTPQELRFEKVDTPNSTHVDHEETTPLNPRNARQLQKVPLQKLDTPEIHTAQTVDLIDVVYPVDLKDSKATQTTPVNAMNASQERNVEPELLEYISPNFPKIKKREFLEVIFYEEEPEVLQEDACTLILKPEDDLNYILNSFLTINGTDNENPQIMFDITHLPGGVQKRIAHLIYSNDLDNKVILNESILENEVLLKKLPQIDSVERNDSKETYRIELREKDDLNSIDGELDRLFEGKEGRPPRVEFYIEKPTSQYNEKLNEIISKYPNNKILISNYNFSHKPIGTTEVRLGEERPNQKYLNIVSIGILNQIKSAHKTPAKRDKGLLLQPLETPQEHIIQDMKTPRSTHVQWEDQTPIHKDKPLPMEKLKTPQEHNAQDVNMPPSHHLQLKETTPLHPQEAQFRRINDDSPTLEEFSPIERRNTSNVLDDKTTPVRQNTPPVKRKLFASQPNDLFASDEKLPSENQNTSLDESAIFERIKEPVSESLQVVFCEKEVSENTIPQQYKDFKGNVLYFGLGEFLEENKVPKDLNESGLRHVEVLLLNTLQKQTQSYPDVVFDLMALSQDSQVQLSHFLEGYYPAMDVKKTYFSSEKDDNPLHYSPNDFDDSPQSKIHYSPNDFDDSPQSKIHYSPNDFENVPQESIKKEPEKKQGFFKRLFNLFNK